VELQYKISARFKALEDEIRLSTGVGQSETLKSCAHSSDLLRGAFALEASTTALQVEERVELSYDWDSVESVKQMRSEVPTLAKALSSCSQDFIKYPYGESSARRAAEAFFETWIKRIESDLGSVKQISDKSELTNALPGSGAVEESAGVPVVPKLQPLPSVPIEVPGPNSPLPVSCVTGPRQGSAQEVGVLVTGSPVTSPSGSPVTTANAAANPAPKLLVPVDVEPHHWRQQLQQQRQQQQIRRAPSPISMHISSTGPSGIATDPSQVPLT